MRGRVLSSILGSLLVALSSNTALAAESAALRPSWSGNQYKLAPNSSLLFSNHDPAFAGPDFQTRMIGVRKSNELKQNYADRNRDYQMRQTYGIATPEDERNHQASMKDMGKVVLFSAKNSVAQEYGHNVHQAEKN